MCPEKFQLDQIQNGRLLGIIKFNMPDIWHAVPDSSTITIKQNVRLHHCYKRKFAVSGRDIYIIIYKPCKISPQLN